MNEYLVCGALIGIGMICLGTGLGIMVYYAHSIQKMEKILTNYQEGGKESLDAIKETRESKLESRLQYVLAQVSWERERASEERDKVAALLSDLSHQLKLPLANVLMYTELLVDEGLSSQEREKFARETRIQARKMQWLIKRYAEGISTGAGDTLLSGGVPGDQGDHWKSGWECICTG